MTRKEGTYGHMKKDEFNQKNGEDHCNYAPALSIKHTMMN